MANTTNDFAHAFLRLREFGTIWSRLRKFSSDTLVVDQWWPAIEAAIAGDKCVFDPDIKQGQDIAILAQRALVAGILTNGRSLLDPLLLQLSRAMGYPQTDPLAVFPILYRYMALNQGSFKSTPRVDGRAFTRNAWSAGASNQGNGTVLRQVVDRYDIALEADAPDILKFVCVQDANSGANPGQEQFAVSGLPYRDNLSRYSTGYGIGIGNQIPVPNLVGVTGDSTRNVLVNPSLSDFSGTGASATFALTGWTQAAGVAASCSIDTTQYYRASNVETTAGSLKVTATSSFTQKIPAGQLDATLCYMLQGACNFSAGGATGSVRIRMGTTATYLVDVTVASGVAGWNTIRPTIDKKLYFANFAGPGDIYVRVDVTVSSGTYILVDDICISPFQNIGGKLLWAIGGSANWVVADTGTITDSVAVISGSPTLGYVQTMLAEVYGKALPAFQPTRGVAPASVTAGVTSGGTAAKGVYGVIITFYNSTTGAESYPGPVDKFVYLDGTNDRIALTAIPTGPAGTTDRYVYITQPDDANSASALWNNPSHASAFYFAAALGDNVATTKTFDPLTTIDLTKPLSVMSNI